MEIRSTFSLLFYIKKHRASKDGEAPIYLRITLNKKSTELSIHRSIDINLWDSENGTVIGNSKISKEINNYLFSIKSSIFEHYKDLRESEKDLSPQSIKFAFLGIELNKGKKIIELFETHNADMKKLKGIDFAAETVKRYHTSLNHTQNYIRFKYKCEDLYLVDLKMDFILGFEMYLKTVRKCNHNSTMKYLKNFRKIINIAILNGYLKNDPFMNYKIKLKKVDKGFLNDEELDILINHKFEFKRLDEIRDCFLFSCFTGLAYSDLKRLNKLHIVTGTDGGKWIKINRLKTETLSSIPLLSVSRKLIEKYKDNDYCNLNKILLPVKSNQKMNAYLKEVSTICGFDKELTTHLARHTFATTVTLNNDIPIESVSKMLGHSSIATTKIYARLLDKKVGRDMFKLNSIYL